MRVGWCSSFEHLEMTFEQCHFKKFLQPLSHTNSLPYFIEFYLCLYKHSKTLIVTKNFKEEV